MDRGKMNEREIARFATKSDIAPHRPQPTRVSALAAFASAIGNHNMGKFIARPRAAMPPGLSPRRVKSGEAGEPRPRIADRPLDRATSSALRPPPALATGDDRKIGGTCACGGTIPAAGECSRCMARRMRYNDAAAAEIRKAVVSRQLLSGPPPPRAEPTQRFADRGDLLRLSGNARVQRWAWPWETDEGPSGGGESGGGGSSESYAAPDEEPLICEPGSEEENACYEPPNYSPADRSWTCNATCNVYAVEDGATCPERVSGTGSGPSAEAACDAAKEDANSKVPAGCNKRHCHGPCRGSQGSRGQCR